MEPSSQNSIKEKNYCLKNIWSPYNTQNTILGKFLFPVAMMWPFVERMDDIYASFMWQKILFNNGMYAHVGEAINRQDRGLRDVFKNDFLAEVEGYVHGHEVWGAINEIDEKDPIRFVRKLMESPNEIVKRHNPYFEAHLKDISRIYG